MMPIEVSIIIPTYNERGNISILLDRIDNSIRTTSKDISYEIIVVDDNSLDGTAEIIAKDLLKKYPIKLVVREHEKGLATAVIEGFKYAKGNIFIVMDADLQHPPEKIPLLINEILNGADIAIASRYIKDEKHIENKEGKNRKDNVDNNDDRFEGLSLPRRIMSRCANYPARLLFRKLSNIRDLQSGFFVFKKDVIKDVELKPKGYKILLEILVIGNYSVVKEIPFKFARREYGETKLGTKTIADYLFHIMTLAIRTGELKRFLKYCTVGIIGIVVNTIMLFLFTNIIGLYYIMSSLIAHETSIIGNFMMNDRWTFKELRKKEDNFIYRAIRYNIAKISGIFISIIFLYIFTEFLEINYLTSNIMAIMTGAMWGYFTSLTVVWKI